MSQKKINWGIIGAGRIAGKFADGLVVLPEAKLLAVASRSLEKANEFADAYDVPHRYGSYEELVSDPEVDVVYIATPHVGHYAHTLLCLHHRKAVLCEKPFAMNRRQVVDMLTLAKEKEVFLMEALWTKFLPATRKVVELVEKGVIGEIKSISADFGFRADFHPEGRLFDPRLGGGALLDIGIYPLFLATTLLGKPDHLKALATFSPTNVDEQCSMALAYKNGAMATLSCSIVSHTPVEACITGTEGSIRMHSRWYAPTSITLYLTSKEPQAFHFKHVGNGYNYEAEEVMTCLREGKLESSVMTHQDSLNLIEMLDWVRKEAGITYETDTEK